MTAALLPVRRASAATSSPMSVSVNPSSAQADVPAAYTFTFKANVPVTTGSVTFTVPAGWTTPQAGFPSDVGFASAHKGTCSSVPANSLSVAPTGTGSWRVSQGLINCSPGQSMTITYANADATTVGTGSYTFGPAFSATTNGGTGIPMTAPVSVVPGPTTALVLSGATTTAAGATYGLAVTAEDAGGDVTPAYSGTVVVTSSDKGTSTKLAGGSLRKGMATFKQVLTTAGSQWLQATDSVTSTITGPTGGLSVAVTPGTAALLAFTPNQPGPGAANSPIPNVGVAVTDAFHNRITAITASTATLSLSKASPQSTFTSGTTTEPFVGGAATFNNLTVSVPGTYAFNAAATGVSGLKGTVTSTPFNVAGHVVISPSTLPSATVGQAYSHTVSAGGGVAPYHWSAVGLPGWLTLNATTGVLSGTPLAATSVGPFTVNVSDSASPANTASAPYTLVVNKAATGFTIAVNGQSSSTINYGGSATLAESGLPSGATGTVTFSDPNLPGPLCTFDYPADKSCQTPSTLTAGSYNPVAAFADADGNYSDSASTNSVSLMVSRVTPPVTWTTPAPIVYGTPLGSTQLDAQATVPGVEIYTPPAGAVLHAGSRALSVSFTPSDLVDYNGATGGVTLLVDPAPLKVTASGGSMTYGSSPPAISPSYVGFVNQDGSGSLTTGASCSTAATSTSPVGSYGSSCDGAGDPDYAFTYVDGSVDITRDTTSVSVSENPSTIAYGAESGVTFSVQVLSGNGEPVPNGESTTVGVGTAACSATLSAGAGTCRIGDADLPSSGTPYAVSASYDGDNNLLPSTTNAAAGLTVTPASTCTAADGAYQAAVLATHPEAYWTLGDGSGTAAADLSGNNSSGTYTGPVALGAPSIVPGDCGPAASFTPGSTGSDSYVTLPPGILNASTTTGTSQSVELWFETAETAADWQAAGNGGNGPDGGGVLLSMERSGPGNLDFAAPTLYVGSDGHLYAEESFVDNTVLTLRSLGPVDDGKPHHAVLTADGTSGVQSLYLDGQYQQSTSDLAAPPASFDPFTSYGMTNDYVGTGQLINWPADNFPTTSGGWRSFNGTIDEVALYPGVLSTTQIEADCTAGLGSTCSQAPPGNVLTATVSGTESFGGTPTFTPDYSGFVNGDTPSAVQGTLTGCTTTQPVTGVGDYAITGCSGLSATNYTIVFDPASTLSVSPGSQTITFNPPATGTVGTPIALSASGGGSSNPVVFNVDVSSDPGVCSIEGDGQTLDLLAAGTCVVDATQAGDANYSNATEVAGTIVVSPLLRSQTISFTSVPPVNPQPGDTYVVRAQVDSGLPITFSIDPDTQSACSVSPLSDTSATVTLALDATCTIHADQPGDGVNWKAAPTSTQQVFFDFGHTALSDGAAGWKYVELAPTDGAGFETPSFDDATWASGTGGFGNDDGGCSWNTPNSVGTPLPDWGAATPSDIFVRHHVDIPEGATLVHIQGTIDNDATVWWNGQEISPPSGGAGLDIQDGSCHSGGIDLVVPGFDVVPGDNVLAVRARNDGGPAFLDLAVTYTPAANSQAIGFTPPSDAVVGGLDTLAATPGASGNPVVFTLDPSDAGTCTLGSDGVTLTYQAAGNCIVRADEAGDATHAAAPSLTAAIPVSRAAPLTFAINPSENPAPVGDTVTYDAEIVGAGPTPEGTVTFYDGNTDICDSVALSGGSAQCDVTYSTADSSVHDITAAYSGDANYVQEGSDNTVAETLEWGATYVALGDSYSAGEGDGDYAYGSETNFCDRSPHAYGPLFDNDANLGSMAFVACSGAITDDLFNPNNEGNGEAAQMCGAPGAAACPDGVTPWLGPSTQTVTLTIGGNDIGFSDVLSKCVQGSYFGVNITNATCLSDPTLVQTVQSRIAALAGQGDATTPSRTDGFGTVHDPAPIHSLSDILASIHAAAPNAHIFVGVYPGLFGSFTGSCTVGTLFIENLGNVSVDGTISSDNAASLNALGAQLDQVIANAAIHDAPWASPVDTASAFAGHGYCDTGDTWFNPLEANVDSTTGEPTFVQRGSFHPSVTGQQSGMEAAFLAARQEWLALGAP